MMLVAEWNRLRPDHPRVGYVRRTLDLRCCPKQHRDDHHRTKDRGARYCVGAAMKDLRHRKLSSDAKKCCSRRDLGSYPTTALPQTIVSESKTTRGW
jgi:hypothetical protein